MRYPKCLILCFLPVLLLTFCTQPDTPAVSKLYETGGRIQSHPLISYGRLYFGNDEGNFYAVDYESGTFHWKFKTDHPLKGSAASGNVSVEMAGEAGDSLIYFLSGNVFYALNKHSGSVAWQYRLQFDPVANLDFWDFHHGAPAIRNSEIYFGSQEGVLYCMNRLNGDLLWSWPAIDSAAIHCTPLIHGDVLYFGDWNGRVYALDIHSMDTIWTYRTYIEQPYPTFGQVNTSFIIKDSLLAFGARNPELQVLNIHTGRLAWKHIEADGGWISGDPLISGDTLFIGGSDCHKMLAFNIHTGELLWEFIFLCNSFSRPVLHGDHLLFTTGDAYSVYGKGFGTGYLYALDRYNGSIVNFKRFSGNVFTTPLSHGNNLYFGADNGNMYKINTGAFVTDQVDLKEKGYRIIDSLSASPNPFSDSIIISFYLKHPATIQAKITDLNGEVVLSLLDNHLEEDLHSLVWHGTNKDTVHVPSGYYRINIVAGEYELNTFLQKE